MAFWLRLVLTWMALSLGVNGQLNIQRQVRDTLGIAAADSYGRAAPVKETTGKSMNRFVTGTFEGTALLQTKRACSLSSCVELPELQATRKLSCFDAP